MSVNTTAFDDAQEIKKQVQALLKRMYDETFSASHSRDYEEYRVHSAHLLLLRYCIDMLVSSMTEVVV